ncbi:MAG: acetyl-CoA C-acyltransferase [Candidatus Promineifilaceae bacterium]|nr:acetyl-CoA C-acyltransferase [Candidatus Promineifilaceae bacterium]
MKNGANEAVILSATRTPIGRMQGAFGTVPASQLGAAAVRGALERVEGLDPVEIDEVLMGNVVSAGLGQNIARQSSILGGLPSSVGATTVNKVCGASLKTVVLAAQAIRLGDGQLFVAGGVESMSQTPHLVNGRQNQLRYGNTVLRDALLVDGLWCPFEDWGMGEAAEFIAEEFEVTREAMDQYALGSHRKAVAAIDEGRFSAEITPVEVTGRKGRLTLVTDDESPRRDTSLEALHKLRPAFKKDGRVTAGNAPGLNDGAAALVIASQKKADSLGVLPLARIVGYAQKAVEPRFIFDAPAHAIPILLDKIGWSLDDVDLIELNEAFAAQILANGYALADRGWNWDKVNVNGGAIALGHPLGATGARILTTLLYALKAREVEKGIAALCLGGGEAVAVAVERIS